MHSLLTGKTHKKKRGGKERTFGPTENWKRMCRSQPIVLNRDPAWFAEKRKKNGGGGREINAI